MNRLRPLLSVAFAALLPAALRASNPIITDVFTADPAAMVHDGTVYLYTGHDEAPDKHVGYVMKEWLCFSSQDMVAWTPGVRRCRCRISSGRPATPGPAR